MSLRYGFLAVEGPHDRAFVGRILRALGFTSFKDELPWKEGREDWLEYATPHEALGGHSPAACFGFWKPWIPSFPKRSQKPNKPASLYRPIDGFPEVWTRTRGDETWSIGVHAAGGTEIRKVLAERVTSKIDWSMDEWRRGLQASRGMLGILVDSDDGVDDAWDKLNDAWAPGGSPRLTPWPSKPGEVVGQNFKVGVFILPDGASAGTVEDLLWPLGRRNLASLAERAGHFIDASMPDLRARKPDQVGAPWRSRVGKARIAAVASILQPGSSNTVTIEDDDWLSVEDLALPALAPLVGFLRGLLDEDPPPSSDDAATG